MFLSRQWTEGGGRVEERKKKKIVKVEVEKIEKGETFIFSLSSLFSLHFAQLFFLSPSPRASRFPVERALPRPFTKALPLPLIQKQHTTMRGSTLARAAAALMLLSLSGFLAASAEQVTSLDKGPWTLSNGQGVSLPVSLPKYALEAMQDAGLVGDPLWR